MAPRTRKIRHDDETRAKIQTSQLINRLNAHVFGEVELSPTQVRSAEILLKKTLPDLSSTEHSGEVSVRRAVEMADDELAAIALRGSEGAAEAEIDPSLINRVVPLLRL